MTKKKMKTPKTGVLNVRVDPKLRYGLDLVARKRGISVSDAVVQAVIAYLEADGLAAKQEGGNPSILDYIWNGVGEGSKLLSTYMVASRAPEYANKDDFKIKESIDKLWDLWEDYLSKVKSIQYSSGYIETIDGLKPEKELGIAGLVSYIGVTKDNINAFNDCINGKVSIETIFNDVILVEATKKMMFL